MLRMIVFFTIVLMMYFLTMVVPLSACPVTPALEAFICNANEEYHHLKLIGEVEILTELAMPGMENLTDEARRHIKPFLNKAKNIVFFNTKAGEALNELYIYWITIIDDSQPHLQEDLGSYQKRSDERYTTLQEKANRLRIVAE